MTEQRTDDLRTDEDPAASEDATGAQEPTTVGQTASDHVSTDASTDAGDSASVEGGTEDTSAAASEPLPAAAAAAQTPAAMTPDSGEAGEVVPGGAAEAETVVTQGSDADEPGDEDVVDGAVTSKDVAGEDGEEQDGTEAAPTATGRRSGSAGTDRRSQLEREGEVAADFLETLLDICDLDGDLDVDVDGDRAAVAIVDSDEGRVPRRLVGQDANVLEALQELTRLAVQSETGERSRLMLDIAGHRAERRATLVGLAKEAIAEVERSGESASLAPMTAFERKVVHDEVLAAGLHSESEGSEPRRYVVISRPS